MQPLGEITPYQVFFMGFNQSVGELYLYRKSPSVSLLWVSSVLTKMHLVAKLQLKTIVNIQLLLNTGEMNSYTHWQR